jgi:hypothetical protein
MIGMFTAAQNRERLSRIEARLQKGGLEDDERAQLEEWKADLECYFADLWRVEGGGAE